MKKIISILSVLLVTIVLFIACNSNTSYPTATKDSTVKDGTPVTAAFKDSIPTTNQKALLAATEIYTCSMHQEVIGDKPGHCSVCGMELVKQKPTDHQKQMIKEGSYKQPKK